MARTKSFKTRAKEFRDKVIQLAVELQVELYAGYLEASHDDNNLIISDTKSEEEVYFSTLTQEE